MNQSTSEHFASGQSESVESQEAQELVRVGRVETTVVAVRSPASAITQHLRAIATRLMVGPDANKARVFAVVSTEAGDGRSFTAANLAAVFAQAGRRTVLIDADFRSPQQHKLFLCEPGPGLAALIHGQIDWQAMRSVDDVPGLTLIPAGDGAVVDPMALTREHFGALIERLRERVDQVVIDTPPGGAAFADAQAIAAHAGAALMVVRAGVTRLSAANRLAESLRAVGADVLGTVFNRR